MYTALAPAYKEAYKIPYHRLSAICWSAKRVKGEQFLHRGELEDTNPKPPGSFVTSRQGRKNKRRQPAAKTPASSTLADQPLPIRAPPAAGCPQHDL